MKIAYVYDAIHPYVIGGVQKRNWEVATRLTRNGHDVHLFGMKHWEGEDILVREGVYLHGVCPPKELFDGGKRSTREAVYIGYRMLPALLKERFDVVDVANFPYFPCFSAKVASLARKSCLFTTWHEVWGDYWHEYLGTKGIVGKAVERATTYLTANVIAVSDMTKRDLEKIGVTKEIKMIPNGIDYPSIQSIRPSDEPSDIIFAGRLIKEKNVDLLIKAMTLVKKEFSNIRCIIIGGGPEKDSLEELARDLNLCEAMTFKGLLSDPDDVIAYMKASKIFVLPSVREGFGIVALEANACGLPVVTVDHPQNATRDLITEGQNGFLCQLSAEDIARNILTALDSREEMREMCMEFSKSFDWGEIVQSLEQVYIAR